MAELRVGEGQQYATLEAAAAAARPGGEVIVAAGVYREGVVANTPVAPWGSQTPGAAVVADAGVAAGCCAQAERLIAPSSAAMARRNIGNPRWRKPGDSRTPAPCGPFHAVAWTGTVQRAHTAIASGRILPR